MWFEAISGLKINLEKSELRSICWGGCQCEKDC